MDLHQRTLRVGLMAILFSLVFRLCSMDLRPFLDQFQNYDKNFSFLISSETGQSVRFSPSVGTFSPSFVESPPPGTSNAKNEPIPSFSDTGLIDVQYACKVDPDLEALLTRTLRWDLYSQDPTVLILHTHTTESYTRKAEDYQETADYRTLDENYNMLSIGEVLARILTQAGISVIQDRELHDYPSYNGSYAHARKAISEYLEQYPSIRLVLDLHRDASEGTTGQLRTMAKLGKETAAQLMIVLGTNHAGYEDNLHIGLKLHAQLETQTPGITRPLQLRAQRFNQDLLPGALLVEVGAAGNTHQEALLAAEQLAQAIIALAKGTA